MYVFILILYVVIRHGNPRNSSCFKKYCHCSYLNLKASCFSLAYIPNIPDYSKTLELTNNKFSHIDSDLFRNVSAVFRPLYRVKKVNCRKNNIVNVLIDEAGFRTVEQLDLTSNNIYSIPNFCIGEKSLAPNLRVLTLNNNAIRYLEHISFKCLYRLEELRLDSNRLTTLGNNVFIYLKSLKLLTINVAPRLASLSPLVFNSSSLEKLKFSNNGFIFDRCYSAKCKRYDVDSVFLDLELSKNFLPDSASLLYRMFSPLIKLQKLNLHAASLEILPENLFQKMQNLRILILTGNKLASWTLNTFASIPSLRTLYLSGNLIHTINKTSFPLDVLFSLELLDLSQNPYGCNCDLKWFVDTIRETNMSKRLSNWPTRYTCSYPNELKRLWLKKYRPTIESCTPWDPTDTIIVFVSASALLGAWFANYEFDAFIVYCDADRHWVHGELLKRLEDLNLKICVHYRDFEPGQPITSNIENFMNKSWKIIVVMSNNFAKSEWCQWELCLVQERRRRKGKDAMVLIMRQQIDSKHMTSPLRTLLYTTPYLKLKIGLGQNIFWKAVIQGVKKTYSDPPMAISCI
ncbi:Hypothetical predicted protein [Mytilus galloprovincialis]|uniref:TIR domain-containing protein n=1 Tax=Mytilus galloprovincialis TaxID=29158 RepID=A0A8B6H220_MYTGA|nr:Hypothetical predicted protein [Mytilus galloprovincialis]